jgi:cbb3-type cytochrome oxidase maturation protein
MEVIIYLIPVVLIVSLAALAGLFWAIRNKQFEDLDGAAYRILFDDNDERPSR